MTTIKMIFFDIDGTLIDMEKQEITMLTMETLRRLQKKGIRLCLATGRSPVGLPCWEDVAFDAYLVFNGSLCYNGRQTIFSHPIPSADVQQLIKNAAALGRPVSIATRNGLAANGWDKDLSDYYGFSHLELKVAENFDKISRQEVFQVMLGCHRKDYSAILSGVSQAKIAAWWDRAVDIIPTSSGKGVGIQKILNYYGLEREETMAFGDGDNDIEMFQAVGRGVAMQNASPALKAVADEICGSSSEDGIYHYCLERALI